MLASLLPGLRDLRTPLAVGYLWVVALWLLLHDWWPESVEAATGPTKFLYELSALLGSAATLAALSFVVYLLGSMLRWRHLFSPLGVVVAGFEHEPLRFGGMAPSHRVSKTGTTDHRTVAHFCVYSA